MKAYIVDVSVKTRGVKAITTHRYCVTAFSPKDAKMKALTMHHPLVDGVRIHVSEWYPVDHVAHIGTTVS